MIGMRDAVESTWSQIIIYLFDGLVVAYFLAFPIVSLVYHPRIRCRLKKCKGTVVDNNATPVIPSNTTAHLVAYRRSNGILDPSSLHVSIENIETTI